MRFSYPGTRRTVHDGLSFRAEAGERLGLVGPSGGGKSSIVRLLLRFYDPDRGRILLGGHDLRALPFAEIRSLISVVNQDTFLFHGTVEENIRLGRPDASHEELEDAARAANIHDFILSLPQGYATTIGEKGIKLSGGQRQRVAIARALLRDTPILVLDEALSAVDAENEAVIQEALDRLMQGRTTLILAHRLSSVIDCDRILVLDGGKVAEQGRHDALMARRGVYASLMAEQAREQHGAGARPDRRAGTRRDRLRHAGRRGEARHRRHHQGRGLDLVPGRGGADEGDPAVEGQAHPHLHPGRAARHRLHRRRRAVGADRAGAEAPRAFARPGHRARHRGAACRACCTGWNPGWRTTWPSACWPRCASTPSASSTRWRRPISCAAAPAI